jgi:1-acyl-sn-glycerol-3-phosphate acyltransferase
VIVIRSIVFNTVFYLVLFVYLIAAMPTLLLPRGALLAMVKNWSRVNLRLLKIICNIDCEFRGLHNIPAGAALIASKHQSMWETFALITVLKDPAYILKRELLWIPFFGWGLALMSPIAIDRRRGVAALRSIARRGGERLAQGFCVVVFPEGTRVAPGERRPYQLGGAWLAADSGAPVVPVAHNAGLVWPRNAFLKRAGTITVRIGPAIESAQRDAQTINRLAQQWIDEQQKDLCPGS